MKTIYAVLNDKLLPKNIAELLLKEGTGSVTESVEITLEPSTNPDFFHLEDLLRKALQVNIKHSFTYSGISDMLLKLLSNNKNKQGKIMVKIIQGEKIFLHIYFI
ncbi:MAG: hypothetical protein KAH95_02260 [Spirochaetales bacterium]|nr:hypothetical protein [Spirochaetales bacterium]